MSEPITITIHPFILGKPKETAVKVLEEAAESYSEWLRIDECSARPEVCRECTSLDYGDGCDIRTDFEDELADVVQTAVNLATRYGIDMADAMRRCEERNRNRGRYNA